MPPSPEQATRGRRKGHATRQAAAANRRAQVAIYRLVRPGMSAEALAVILSVSPSTIRGDWRAIKKSCPPVP